MTENFLEQPGVLVVVKFLDYIKVEISAVIKRDLPFQLQVAAGDSFVLGVFDFDISCVTTPRVQPSRTFLEHFQDSIFFSNGMKRCQIHWVIEENILGIRKLVWLHKKPQSILISSK